MSGTLLLSCGGKGEDQAMRKEIKRGTDVCVMTAKTKGYLSTSEKHHSLEKKYAFKMCQRFWNTDFPMWVTSDQNRN